MNFCCVFFLYPKDPDNVLGGKLGRIQKITWFLAKRGCLIGGNINPVLTLCPKSLRFPL